MKAQGVTSRFVLGAVGPLKRAPSTALLATLHFQPPEHRAKRGSSFKAEMGSPSPPPPETAKEGTDKAPQLSLCPPVRELLGSVAQRSPKPF